MGTPTSLSVSVDQDEYSRFEITEGRATITVSVIAAGGGNMSGEVITVQLMKARRLRTSSVYSTTYTISATSSPATNTVTIYLPDVRDASSVSLLRRGKYFVKATSVTNTSITGSSSDFPISIVTAQQMRRLYLFGLPMEAYFMRAVKFQPRTITGVEIYEISRSHPLGFGVLNLNVTPSGDRMLAWSGGESVSIPSSGQYILPLSCENEYIIVKIADVDALPSVMSKEELLVTKDVVSDYMLQQYIERACDWLENDKLAGLFLEPTAIATDLLTPELTAVDWDVIVPALTYYSNNPTQWIDIQVPYMSLLQMNRLWGAIAATHVVDVNLDWVQIAEKSGFTQLVPFNATTAFQFIGLLWVETLRGNIPLPNFWHFSAIAGLRETDPILIEVVGKKAAIEALIVAGHAFRGGYASQSISRDGVSESVSFTQSSVYGIYSATIEAFDKFLNREIKQLKGRYKGPNFWVC
jgi:hypothetical protein